MSWFTDVSSPLRGHDSEEKDVYSLAPPADESRVIRQELHDAQALLAYALAEGYAVDLHIIQDIRDASMQLHGPGPVAAEPWARFEHAYGSLARLLSPLTADVLHSLPARERWSSRLGIGVCAILISITLMILTSFLFPTDQRLIPLSMVVQIIAGLLGGLLFLLILWARLLFTDVVTRKIMRDIILFCYLFTLFFLLSPSLLVFLPAIPPERQSALQSSPIGIVFGCVKPSGTGDDAEVGPKELSCARAGKNGQWLIKIGGGMTGGHSTPVEEGSDGHGATSALGDGPITQHVTQPIAINGGIAVPLYVVVFALWGGAVNMLRRVPEYQWRGLDVKDALSKEQARVSLIFQMTQVLAAPLIALTAYYLLAPSTQQSSVALGFVSGFASHTVLQTIRAVTDTLTPAKLEATGLESPTTTGDTPRSNPATEKPPQIVPPPGRS